MRHGDSISELVLCFPLFLFFLETVSYRTLLVDLVVPLRLYLRRSYFCVKEMLWSPCAVTICSNYMRTYRFNKKRVCSEQPCSLGVFSDLSSVHDRYHHL